MQSQAASTDYVFQLWAWFEANLKRIGIAAGILALLVFVYSFYSYRQNQREITAGQALTQAVVSSSGTQLADDCLKIATDYSGTLAGQRALLEAGTALFTAGKYADAQPQFQKFLDAYPDNYFAPQAQLGVAACLDALGKDDLAAAAYSKAADQMTDVNVALTAKFALARITAAQGKPADAARLYAEVARALQNTSMGSEAGMLAEELKAKLPATPAGSTPVFTSPFK